MTNVKRAIAACAGPIVIACAVIQPATAADIPPQYYSEPVEERPVYRPAYRYVPVAPRVYYEPAPRVVVVVPQPYYLPPRRVYVVPGYGGYGPYAARGYGPYVARGYGPYVAGGYGYRGWYGGPRYW